MSSYELEDVQALRKTIDGINPADLADLEREIDLLAVGDLAKVGIVFAGCVECPWVRITAITAEGFRGELANDLIFANDDLAFGDEIAFERRHVHSVDREGGA
ncbi:MAG: hypothetical protein WD534_00985 [Phycisphaeraceae bacterium]